MCLAVPAKVVAINDSVGKVDIAGVTRDISLMLLPDTQLGDYVLVHAGFAMQKVTEQDAAETYALMAEMNGAPRTVQTIDEAVVGGEAAQHG